MADIDDIYACMENRVVTDNRGIQWRVRRREWDAVYPYPHHVVKHWMEVTERGKKAPAYRKTKAELHDDWGFSLEEAGPELFGDLVRKLKCD